MNSKTMPAMLLMLAVIVASIVFAVDGFNMHSQVPVEEAKFQALQADYWIVSKAERDSAPTGSELNQQLVEIRNYPSELTRLKLIGVGRILMGIFFLLFAILIALVMMPTRLATIIKKTSQPKA